MAGRKAQHDAEYFPFFAKDGRTLFMLQSKFGLEGIGFFTNLLRLLCTTPHHHLDLSDPMQALYTWSKIGLNDEQKAVQIIEMMVATGKIDRQLWAEKRVIYSQDFVDSLSELYAKRKEKALTIYDIRGIYSISAPEMPISAPEIPGNAHIRGINTQRRGEERREEKSLRVPENPAPEKSPDPTPTPPDDFDPQPNPQTSPASTLKIPANVKLSPKDLDEIQARFGMRSQEALNKIGAIYAAKDYGYKNHWAGVKLWLAEHSSPFDWLDGKKQPKAELSPRQEEAAKPVPRADVFDQGVEAGKTQLSGTTAKDFIRQAQAAKRAPVDDFDPVAS